MKKVLLIVIDALASRVVLPAMADGRLPNLRALAQAGELAPECISIFPSITPAATSSIITGVYPCDHGIAGDYWYDYETNDVAYFGADFQVIWNRGLESFFEDFLVCLNQERLQAQTLFQYVEQAGYRAASLNYLIFHGDVPHGVNLPLLFQLWPGIEAPDKLDGPQQMRLGDFVKESGEVVDPELNSSGPLNRYGFADAHTVQDLAQLVENGALPELTVAYFPDNDFDSHARGPEAAVTTLEAFDKHLGELIARRGGLEALLAELCIFVTGDHSQTDMVPDEAEAAINLTHVLEDFDIAAAGTPWSRDDQLVICPNLRVAQVYYRRPTAERLDRTCRQLLTEPRIDQVFWGADVLGDNERGHYVATADRGRLHFWPGDDGPQSGTDEYGCSWSWEGDLRAVDGTRDAAGRLHFGNYPNAFERIACGLRVPTGGHLWVTARPGYEILIPGMEVHPGGSHAALHALDSTVPLFMAGQPAGMQLPKHPRTIDVLPLCLAVLGIEAPRPAGASHISGRTW